MKIPQYIVISIFCIIACISCKTKAPKITSEGILSEEELVATLYDIHMLDAEIFTYNTANKTDIKLSPAYYDSVIFAKHECNDSIFRKSVEEYTLAGKIKDIYNDVIDSLNKTKTILEKNNHQAKTEQ